MAGWINHNWSESDLYRADFHGYSQAELDHGYSQAEPKEATAASDSGSLKFGTGSETVFCLIK